MSRIRKEEFIEARESCVGWCIACGDFTRDGTEPDAEDYDCPQCGEFTVVGAWEHALVMGLFDFMDEEG